LLDFRVAAAHTPEPMTAPVKTEVKICGITSADAIDAAVSAGAAALILATRLNPLWILAVGGALGGFGLL